MNQIVKRLSSAGDTFLPKMHLKQPGCPYSASEQFTKNKERTKKSTETRDSTDIYQNELEKVCFQHDYGLGKF